MKKFTVSCLGLGMRGNTYLSIMNESPEKYEIVSLCDLNTVRLSYYKNLFKVKNENAFDNDKDFFAEVRSDLLLICTQDKDHVGNIMDALKAGYKNILVEKPFTVTMEDIDRIKAECKRCKANIYVCHVLRYAPAFLKAKEYIDSGKLGTLKAIDALERVGMYHQAHSYVRGHYKNKATSSPMIMAKCCHDLDLLVWYADSLCDSLSSIGSLTYFVKENKPEGASDRCSTCQYSDTCRFDAYRLYNGGYLNWAKEFITDVRPVTSEAIKEACDKGPFGTCVFNGDNDVVDNQTVMMKFRNGIEATLRMTAFTPFGGRRYHFFGTDGDLILDESLGTMVFRDSDGKTEETAISTLVSAKAGHGGGDAGLVENLYKILCGEKSTSCTSLEYSIESHRMALFAEESRLEDGKQIKL